MLQTLGNTQEDVFNQLSLKTTQQQKSDDTIFAIFYQIAKLSTLFCHSNPAKYFVTSRSLSTNSNVATGH